MKNKEKWFETRKITVFSAIISLIGGLLFLNHNSITGNIILSNVYNFSLISMIGLLLILCSMILIIYSIKKNKN